MDQSERKEQEVILSVENIGGISEQQVAFEPGINVLAGRNATNRTSLLQSLMAALGSEDVSLKTDADEGSVTLHIQGETYTRRLVREGASVVYEGKPYLDDPELADLFAFLLPRNEARQAVLTHQNLREPIMRPVDTAAINAEIDSLKDEKAQIDEKIEGLSRLHQELSDLESDRQELIEEIDETEVELEAKQEEIKRDGTAVDESREEKGELDERMSELSEVRSELDSVRQELRAQRESLGSLRDDRDRLEGDLEEPSRENEAEIEEIDAELDRLRDRKQTLRSEIGTLQQIIQFNEDNLEGASTNILEAFTEGGTRGAVTDELLENSETVVCWTCGHDVDRSEIEETLERLRELRQSKLSRSRDLDDQIEELETRRAAHEERQREQEQIRTRLRRTRSQIETRRERIDSLEARRGSLEEEIEEIEAAVADLQRQDTDAVISLHKEANELEVTLNRLERDRERITEKIGEIESELERREELDARREQIADELRDLRTRIDRIEAEAVESFNRHMETVLDILEYDNLARIWLERGNGARGSSDRSATDREFALHVVRESDAGTAYEDTISNLSESEREVTGLVFALAGYLVHDVHEICPFMLLDSLEAIDSDRILALLEYLQDYPEYLVAALLPEDAGNYHQTIDL